MKYNLSQPLDAERFKARTLALARKGAAVELTELTGRSGSQNRYLHLAIGAVAMETGVSLNYAKEEYFKRLANHRLFVVTVNDPIAGTVEHVRSSSSLTKEQMSEAIDRFVRWAAEQGIYIPAPVDQDRLKDLEIELGRVSRYL